MGRAEKCAGFGRICRAGTQEKVRECNSLPEMPGRRGSEGSMSETHRTGRIGRSWSCSRVRWNAPRGDMELRRSFRWTAAADRTTRRIAVTVPG